MKLVTFNRAMAPFVAGEARLVPDDMALRLQADGVIESCEDFPPRTESGVPLVVVKPASEKPKSPLPLRRQSYQTK